MRAQRARRAGPTCYLQALRRYLYHNGMTAMRDYRVMVCLKNKGAFERAGIATTFHRTGQGSLS